jgi:hypothetical protein
MAHWREHQEGHDDHGKRDHDHGGITTRLTRSAYDA